jgi:Ca2+/Na+ antiporter
MKLNQKKLLFILLVLLILVSIYYNEKLLNSNNNKLLLLFIIIVLYIFFNKFTNKRIEKFYENKYKITEKFNDQLETNKQNQDNDDKNTNQYLNKLFLNKSKYHSSSPSINIVKTEDPSITKPDNMSTLRKSVLNFYESITKSNDNTDDTDDDKEVSSGDTAINDIFQFNYGSVDDLLDKVNERQYDFKIKLVDFNTKPVDSIQYSNLTGAPTSSSISNEDTDDTTQDTDDTTQDTDDTTQDTILTYDNVVKSLEDTDKAAKDTKYQISPAEYKRRLKKTIDDTDKDKDKDDTESDKDKDKDDTESDEDDTESDEDDTESDEDDTDSDEINKEEKQNIYNALFKDMKKDENRDGINFYFNKFFSSIQDLFN